MPALDLADEKLAFGLRIAPAEMRMLSQGKVGPVWPVIDGVIVDGERAYAADQPARTRRLEANHPVSSIVLCRNMQVIGGLIESEERTRGFIMSIDSVDPQKNGLAASGSETFNSPLALQRLSSRQWRDRPCRQAALSGVQTASFGFD